jgi:hypothetical protein
LVKLLYFRLLLVLVKVVVVVGAVVKVEVEGLESASNLLSADQ